ncbi:hypothetical protein VP1G_07507 [Cytospora mali]|uniref:Uncharacterized protein n=1 Tax=Cytospora mali TaxID=578113 RepID=A0A194V8L9_CYTMA|nr:hypothetical protein VP1G_07507 [Valsa mali var. pyri (nom. inval.)]
MLHPTAIIKTRNITCPNGEGSSPDGLPCPKQNETHFKTEHLCGENSMRSQFVKLIVEQPLTPRNHAMWTKIRVLLHHFEGPWDGNLFSNDGHGTALIQPNPAGPDPVTPEMWLVWKHVEPPLFDCMAMTSRGTLVFEQTGGALLFADQDTLDTGRLLLCDIGSNAQLKASARVWPMFAEMIYNFVYGKAWTASRLIFENDWLVDEEP